MLFLHVFSLLHFYRMCSFLISLGGKYLEIADNGKNPKIDRTPINLLLMEILLKIKYIKTYSEKNNRVYHYNED